MENRGDKRKSPVLYLVLPCYNEEAVLPVSIPMFLEKLEEMLFHGKIDQESRVLLVDDGSRDRTWEFRWQRRTAAASGSVKAGTVDIRMRS